MFLTNDDLPKSILVNHKELFIKTDFRHWITFETMMRDPEIADVYRPFFMMQSVLVSSYQQQESDLILESLFSFYRLEKPIIQTNATSNDIAYDFAYDMDLIIAAFRQQYQIDLLRTQMHWWEFSAYFKGLTKQTKFIEIVGYRTADLSKMPKEQKQQYANLKKHYAVPSHLIQSQISQESIEKDLVNKLKRGDLND